MVPFMRSLVRLLAREYHSHVVRTAEAVPNHVFVCGAKLVLVVSQDGHFAQATKMLQDDLAGELADVTAASTTPSLTSLTSRTSRPISRAARAQA